ncbi:hypothetical protein PInf_023858 [Phytophthora infestans]|nr:hypothetical protein PInf_023858 [Phytophthora infestans]
MTASPMPRRIRLNMEQKIAMCKYAKDMRAKGKLSNTQLAAWATRAFKLEKSLSRDAARNVIAGESKWAAMEPCQLERKQLVSPQIQETDARIIKVFKAVDGKVEAITGNKMAYDEISPKTIQNCWRHAGILSDRSKIASLLN